MSKKILSAIALTMAMTLTLGMTVFAAESPAIDGANTIVADDVKASIKDVTDASEKAALETEAAELKAGVSNVEGGSAEVLEVAVLKDAKRVLNKIAVAVKGSGAKYNIAAAADIEVTDFEGGVVKITLDKKVDAANTVVLHLNGDVWEVVPAKIDGKVVSFNASDLSPVVVAELASKAATNDDDDDKDDSATTSSPAESPKTGETLPVAGIMTLICVAGAVVCAKKVRYNN